jgi:hypothetical protein
MTSQRGKLSCIYVTNIQMIFSRTTTKRFVQQIVKKSETARDESLPQEVQRIQAVFSLGVAVLG